MERGQLSQQQRDAAWQGKSLEERREMTAFNFALGGEEEMRRAGLTASATAVTRSLALDALERDDKERKEQTDRVILLATIDEARQFAAQRGAEADNYEAEFEARFGDAWREEIANRVMEPDEIPERRDGESMEDYRERLSDALIERMIDPATGRIRPEFQDDPERNEFAQWALARYEERIGLEHAAILDDENSTPEQLAASNERIARSSFNESQQIDQAAESAHAPVAERTNVVHHDVGETAAETEAASPFASPS
ncbi:hypothetical protein [Maricaulis sp.]|uniref:hypothetical protein n=1 Tax=Maricaulis sp. TaxID=1486257 RepID=UPI0026281650|nr:hypothetical protein [Maricaulis sp.]